MITSLRFQFTRFKNILKLIFKRQRKLEILRVEYFKLWRFENSYLVIEFEFKNATWFKIGSLSRTDFKKPVVLNLNKINEEYIVLKVYGLLQKRLVQIDLKREAFLNSLQFKTEVNNVREFSLLPPKIRINSSNFIIEHSKARVRKYGISISTPNIKPTNKKFIIEEHL